MVGSSLESWRHSSSLRFPFTTGWLPAGTRFELPPVGSAGVHGFVNDAGQSPVHEARIPGGHSAFIGQIDEICGYLTNRDADAFEQLKSRLPSSQQPSWLLNPMIAILPVLGIIIAVGLVGLWFIEPAGRFSIPVGLAYITAVAWLLTKV